MDSATAGLVHAPATPRLPPGLPWPPIAQLIRWWRRPIDFFEECARRYGDVFTIRFPRFLGVPGLPGSNIFVVFSDPEAVRDVFTGDGELLRSGEANRRGDVIVGPGSLLLLDGARHLRERPLFHGERMRAYGDVMLAAAERAIDAWPVGRAFPIHPSMQAVTLDVILRTVFGLEEASELEPLRRALGRLLEMLVNPQGLGLQV